MDDFALKFGKGTAKTIQPNYLREYKGIKNVELNRDIVSVDANKLNGILNSKFKAFGSLKPINSEAYNALVKLKQDSYFSLGNVVQVNKNLLTNAGIKLNEVKAISPTAATASMSSLINAPRIVTRTPTTITNAVKNINSSLKILVI
jgi:hypothetical protein